MKPTRPSTLIALFVLAAGATWALLGTVYKSLPPLPWTIVPALVIAAAAEAWIGRDVRRRIMRRKGAEPAPPLFVYRMAVLAKASSLAGALISGIAIGFVGYLSGSLSATYPRRDLISAAVTVAGGLILVAAALYLEWCCRVPKTPDRDDDQNQATHPNH